MNHDQRLEFALSAGAVYISMFYDKEVKVGEGPSLTSAEVCQMFAAADMFLLERFGTTPMKMPMSAQFAYSQPKMNREQQDAFLWDNLQVVEDKITKTMDEFMKAVEKYQSEDQEEFKYARREKQVQNLFASSKAIH